MQRLVSGLVVASLSAVSMSAGDRAASPRAVFVLAARDSKLLTVCPAATEVKTAKGSYWESDRAIMVSDGPYGLQLIRLMETRSSLLMPAPAGGPGDPAGTTATLGEVLDRDAIAPDPAVKRWLEQAFAKQTDYRLADSSETADIVFVAESFWRPLIAQTDQRSEMHLVMLGDLQPNLLQGILAFAVPAAVYRQHPGDVNAWLAARTWDGSVFYHTPRPGDPELASASPQDLVKAFVKRAKPAPDHPPVCAASNHPFSLEGVDAKGAAAQQAAAEASGSVRRGTFRAEVTYVAVPVRAADASGSIVDALVAGDFTVKEDGVEQKVDRLLPIAEPFDLAILIDTSASMRLEVADVQNAVLTFVDTLRSTDRAMPVSFNDRITAHSTFLSDHRRLRLSVFQVGRGEGTRLWDALHLVKARLDAQGAGPRSAVVLFTDGVDTRSRLRDGATVMRELAESNLPVYVVQYDTRGRYRPVPGPLTRTDLRVGAAPPGAFDAVPYIAAEEHLQALAETTGGRVFRAQDLETAITAFGEVARELKGLYTLAYYPSNQARDGSPRAILVTCRRPDLSLRYRSGYRAPMGK